MTQLLAHKDQTLVAHLEGVSQRAEGFAAAFDAAEHGRMADLLHDLGQAERGLLERVGLADQAPWF